MGAHEAGDEVIEGLEDFAVARDDRGALAVEGFIFCLFGADPLVLKKVAVRLGELFH